MQLPGVTQAALLQALRQQLEGGTVPQVRLAYDRLRAEGCDHGAAMALLAGALRRELELAALGGGDHQPARYDGLLAELRGPAVHLAELRGPAVHLDETERSDDEDQD